MKPLTILSRAKKYWPGLVFALAVVINQFCPVFSELEPAIKYEEVSVLQSDHAVRASRQQILLHNAALRDFFSQRMLMESSNSTNRESSLMQMRGFYVIIIVALLSIIFSPKKPITRGGSLVSMAIIGVMYALEIHQTDLNRRYQITGVLYSVAADSLTNSLDRGTTWYVFNNSELLAQMNTARNSSLIRKIHAAFRPGVDQFALYAMPFILFFSWLTARKDP